MASKQTVNGKDTPRSATETLTPGAGFAGAFASEEVPRFAYRAYDCIPASEGSEFTDLDLLVTAGLNARIDMRALARLRSFAGRAAADLDLAHTMQPDFLDLARDEVGNNPLPGSAGWHLYRAWEQGMATPMLEIARVHKLLHHKRPRLVPLLDNRTIVPIRHAAMARRCTGWQLIWDEIHDHDACFKQLAEQFDEHARDTGGVSLSWLRLYDILIWMRITSERPG